MLHQKTAIGSSLAARVDTKIGHERAAGTNIISIQRGDFQELHITLRPLANDNVADLLLRLREVLCDRRAGIVRMDLFGSRDAWVFARHAMRLFFGGVNWPLLWVHDDSRNSNNVSGVQVLAVSGTEVEPIVLDDQIVGSVYSDGEARHCCIGGVGPENNSALKPIQVEQTYARLEAALGLAGMKFTDIHRTWFYLENILAWYDDFNRVRTTTFKKHGIFDRLVPASTGIGAANSFGAGLTLGAWALQPLRDTTRVFAVPSPLQCPAPAYGSSFSRAVEIHTPSQSHLLISGTASIEPGGQTAHVGDLPSQIELTFKVVQAILESRAMNFGDVTRATAYFRNAGDMRFFDAWMGEQGLKALPCVSLRADVCRDDLLFELELDAIALNAVANAGERGETNAMQRRLPPDAAELSNSRVNGKSVGIALS